MSVPVTLVLAGEDGEPSCQRTVEPLNQAVALWVERRGPRLLHPKPSTDLDKDDRFKVTPLVTVKLSREPPKGRTSHPPAFLWL